jgi:hypothetical protein
VVHYSSPYRAHDRAWEFPNLSSAHGSAPNLNHPWTLGDNQLIHGDRVAREEREDLDEGCVEQIYGQLWFIPKPDREKAPDPHHGGGCLVWIWHDLARDKRVCPEDCHPVGQFDRLDQTPRPSASREICVKGGIIHPTQKY